MKRRRQDRPQRVKEVVPLEHQEQAGLVQIITAMSREYPDLELMHAIPNGGHRTKSSASKIRAEGAKPGIPDLFLPVARGKYHGLYVELKRTKGWSVSADQKKMIPRLRLQGYRVEICPGADYALRVICDYMGIRCPLKVLETAQTNATIDQ